MAYLFSILLVLAPLYVWRFSIGGIPTNALMLANFIAIAIALIIVARRNAWRDVWESVLSIGKPLLIAISLFGAASIIALVSFGITAEKFAQWTVLYAQPLALFIFCRYAVRTEPKALNNFYKIAYVFVGVAGLLAIIQYFTLATLPMEWWGNANEPKRAIAFFAHANAFGLFVTPVLAWLIPDVVQKFRDAVTRSSTKYVYAACWLVGAAGLFLSLSRGAWLGLMLAAGVCVLISANKKMILAFAVAGLLLTGVVMAAPNLRYRVLLPFQGEKSAVARLSIWDTGLKMVKDSPVLGKGMNGFSDNWDSYNTDPNLEHYNFPHNIFLNFWIDLGLLGMLSVVAILVLTVARGIARRATNPAMLGMLLAVVAIVSHGLIDIPYLKNDLALAFWIMLAFSL